MSLSPKIRSRYSESMSAEFANTKRGVSRTQQQFKDECDVNKIMEKYQRSGVVAHLNRHRGFFGDFTGLSDYQANLERLMMAQNSFMDLPSSIRKRFENNPGKLLEFVGDVKNRDEAIELGLILKPEVVPDSMEVAVTKALAANDAKRAKKKET